MYGRYVGVCRRVASAVDRPESSAVGESVECRRNGEQEEQREAVDERTDPLYSTGGHRRHPPQTGHTRRYPQLQEHRLTSITHSSFHRLPYDAAVYGHD